jgi:hypothetical protein
MYLLSISLLTAQESVNQDFFKEHYFKKEFQIPTRDGVKLFTSLLIPKDTTKLHPILLTRTPYSCSPYGVENFPTGVGEQGSYYARRDYILVTQDVRGRYMSEGEFVDVRPIKETYGSNVDIDETTDTYDTVDWLVKNVKGNNGNVGIKGISYPGFYSWTGTVHAHPAVKATSPQAPVSQWMGGDDWYHNGAILVSHAFSFYARFGFPRSGLVKKYDSHFNFPTPDGYKFFLESGALPNFNKLYLHDSVSAWSELMTHGTWDAFWKERSVLPHLKNLKPATLVVGGWFDTENLYGALQSYQAAEKQSSSSNNRIVMGPWAHGWWNSPGLDSLGDIKFGSVTTQWYTENIEGPFFEHHLNGAADPNLAEANVFLTGANEWKKFDVWPPKNVEMKDVYLGEHESLLFELTRKTKTEFDEYVNDPHRPVPYTNETRQWYNAAFMLEDQRFASRRPDVLVYQTEVLNEDLTIAGPINVNLIASTSGTDCDWIVKVIDVFPDSTSTPPNHKARSVQLGGYQMMIRGDVLRGKFRNSLEKPEPFTPNKPTEIHFVLQDAFHRFKKGHRLMVQVQSSWFPMIDRNPGKFLDIYKAKDSDFQKTTQRVYRNAKMASRITFGVLKLEKHED